MNVTFASPPSDNARKAIVRALNLLSKTFWWREGITFGDWLGKLPLALVFFQGTGPRDFSMGVGSVAKIRMNDLSDPTFLSLYDRTSHVGYANLAALILHEVRHTDPGGGKLHYFGSGQTPTMDGSLDDQGAWWIEAEFYKALAMEDRALSLEQRRIAASDAVMVMRNVARPPLGLVANASAIAKVPHLSADHCQAGGAWPYCGRSG